MNRKRVLQLVLVVAALAIFFVLSRSWPKDQTVHVTLGPLAPEVTAVSLRYGVPAGSGVAVEEWAREARFAYAAGAAPEVITHTPRLAGGDYVVEVEVDARGRRATVDRRVRLEGGNVNVDVSRSLRAEEVR